MKQLNIMQIQELIPHRHPFLLIDEIEDYEPGEYAVGYKCVTYREDFFAGHFPEEPVMPGVLILEAKNVSGKVTGRAEDRELSQYKPSRGRRPAEQKRMYNPLLQVKGHQTTLQNILRAAGLSVPVRTAVYFANPNAEVSIDGAVNVFTVHDSQPLDQSMRRLLGNGEKVDTAAVIRAVKQSFSK